MESTDFVATRGSALKAKPESSLQVVSFESYKAKKKKVNQKKKKAKKQEENILDMEAARNEITQFSINGLKPKQRREAKMKLAIKLGAKPPKNKYVNYKTIIEQRFNEKKDKIKLKKLQQEGKAEIEETKKPDVKDKRKNGKWKTWGILDIYGTLKKHSKK
ncbi:PREDICTED: uncharacterized protein C1orf131-like [Nicrophorus vespilloides]|uniref:Uncharacterized protein C1orf131-like n=1 Tax=Nicrophorus vespilloides TaxID=110193 RepID=A0ABM1NKF6_NICVS|nr:PREDICTED: uncharacterized protein C1orf131-like [Nicrophorus vespilloides]